MMNVIISSSITISKIGEYRLCQSFKQIAASLRSNQRRVLRPCAAPSTNVNIHTSGFTSSSTTHTDFPSLSSPTTTATSGAYYSQKSNFVSSFRINNDDSFRRLLSRSSSSSSSSSSNSNSNSSVVDDEDENRLAEDEADDETTEIAAQNLNQDLWERMLQELIAYREEYGDCLVPKQFEPNLKLGTWVDRQRQQYRYRQEGQKSHMDDQRIAILEREGFVWSFYELRWELQYDELVQYKEKFGNCVVPIDAPEYEKLWTWVFKQKRTYSMRKRGEPSPITDERIEKLEKIGFIWDLFEDLWIMRLTELREYKAYHGDCIVPRPNPSNPQLAKWVEVQRRQMKLHQQGEHSNMTKERIRLLEREGFVWDVHEYRWQGRFEELSEFYMANGHHRIPTKTKIGSSLAKWGTRQKEQRERMLNGEKTLMTDNRFALLRSINFF